MPANACTSHAWDARNAKLVDAGELVRAGGKHPPDSFVCTHDEQHALELRTCRASRFHVDGYFAHVSGLQCGGGESQTHIAAKYALQRHWRRYRFLLRKCGCGLPSTLTWEDGRAMDGVSIERRLATGTSHVAFDACMMLRGEPRVALEVLHTHATGPEKIAATRAAGVAFAEFAAADVLAMAAAAQAGEADARPYLLHNARVELFTCAACVVRAARTAEAAEKQWEAWEATRAAQLAAEQRREARAALAAEQRREARAAREAQLAAEQRREARAACEAQLAAEQMQEARAAAEKTERATAAEGERATRPALASVEEARPSTPHTSSFQNIVAFTAGPLDQNPPSAPGIFFHAR